MGYQDIFKRYELKYLISTTQKERILEATSSYIKEDDFCRSTICNIYYDTPDNILIRRSLEKPVYKEKLRLRSYGQAKPDGTAFIELKKKYKGIVYKRRVAMTYEEAVRYLEGKAKAPRQSQITDEIDYVLSFYQGIAPAMYLSYDREAYQGRTDKNLRITFDENILWRTEDKNLCHSVYGAPILEQGQILMEIKVGGAMPLSLAHLLSEEQIYKTSFSKYGRAYMINSEKKEIANSIA